MYTCDGGSLCTLLIKFDFRFLKHIKSQRSIRYTAEIAIREHLFKAYIVENGIHVFIFIRYFKFRETDIQFDRIACQETFFKFSFCQRCHILIDRKAGVLFGHYKYCPISSVTIR